MENVIYFVLDIAHQVDISYYKDLEDILAIVYYNHKYERMIKVEAPLIKKWGSIEDDYIGVTLHIDNNLWLQRKVVRVGQY